ncbi:MAG TPA: formate dehydrogenase subunit alpha [Chloroflexota bacterium]|nr:formate dehydrogenase subunit alpha [Chloroflexota bacterium]
MIVDAPTTLLHVKVDDESVDVPVGASALDAINAAGVYVPQLCKDPDQKARGACRSCLVQIEGLRGFPASCTTPCADGMQISVASPAAARIRRGVIELTLGMHPDACQTNRPNTHNDLVDAARAHAIETPRFAPLPDPSVDASNPFFVLDMQQCILCARCVTACDEVQHIGAIALLGRGAEMKVGTFADQPLRESICTSCGSCFAACPTGAIYPKKVRAEPVKRVDTTCPYCGVGCAIKLDVSADDAIVRSDDQPANPSSQGMLCVKGRFGFEYVNHRDRLKYPLIRRHGQLERASWDEALDLVADKLVEHRGSFGALASAKGTNEDAYVIQKFVRSVMDSNNVDHCTRLCHSPSVHAMLQSLGSGATSNSYLDYENAGCLMVVGSDSSSNHPVVTVRFRRAVKRGATLIVVNPKWTELNYYADIWLRQLPGTDVALFNGLAYVLLDEGLADTEFIRTRTEGFAEWAEAVREYPPAVTSVITGVPEKDLIAAARAFGKPAFSGSCMIWGMGISQHSNGTANAHGVINLALAAGMAGKPGNGISPLRGQNNVQGCGDAGCIPDNLPGYQALTAANRSKFGAAWGQMTERPAGLTVTSMVEAAGRGDLKAMYVVGENPFLDEANLSHARDAMHNIEFLVVQDIFLQETAEAAHVVLPATSFAEKEGTFTNSERRVQRVRAALAPVGESRPDWEITCDIARRVCRRLGLDASQFSYRSPREIMDEMASLTPIIAGISHDRLDREGGIQWPCPSPDHPGTPNLYTSDFPRPGGLARLTPVRQGPAAMELPDDIYPIVLNTGRVLYHWHGGTMTTRVDGLVDMVPRVQVTINPIDADTYGVLDGRLVQVTSRRGSIVCQARVNDEVSRGELFMPFVSLQGAAANFLTNNVYDPNGMPEYKVCAVRIEPA